MATNKILDATSKIVALLEPLEDGDRLKVIQAAFVLLGVNAGEAIAMPTAGMPSRAPGLAVAPSAAAKANGEKEYFDAKQPASKGEELAVACRYREEVLDASSSMKEELKAVFKAARRNFDDRNFARDLDNARTKGLFNRGSGKDVVLSHYGQNYVDAMPDRDAVNAIRKPKGAGVKRAPVKRAAKTARSSKK